MTDIRRMDACGDLGRAERGPRGISGGSGNSLLAWRGVHTDHRNPSTFSNPTSSDLPISLQGSQAYLSNKPAKPCKAGRGTPGRLSPDTGSVEGCMETGDFHFLPSAPLGVGRSQKPCVLVPPETREKASEVM